MKRKFAFGVKEGVENFILMGLSGNALKTPTCCPFPTLNLTCGNSLLNLWKQMGIFLRFSPKHVGLQFFVFVEGE